MPDAAFHAITAGTAWLRMAARPPVRLMPGAAILLPTGAPHALSSEPAGPLVPWAELTAGPGYEESRLIAVGSPPTQTRVLCATYRYDPAVSTPLFTLLPEVMHVPA